MNVWIPLMRMAGFLFCNSFIEDILSAMNIAWFIFGHSQDSNLQIFFVVIFFPALGRISEIGFQGISNN